MDIKRHLAVSINHVTTEDIERLLKRCPNRQCALDPVPTWLVKAAGSTMATIGLLAKLVNASLDSAVFRSSMKHAIVTPIVKKPGMDLSSLSSYRPISNLPFGLCGTALMWFRSYLSGRTYRVVYACGTSSVVYIVCSVPQGSVLGPVLFVLYVADIADIVNRHGVTLHSFADDTQLYLHCCREDITMAATRLEECIVDVGRWMSANRLKLNTDKTELLWTGSRHSVSQLNGHGPSIQLGADTIPACDHVRLLGVIISADLSLDRHVSVVISASFYWLRQLRRVRRSLDDESAAILVHAFVASRVDYCNLLLAGAPKSVTDKLQRVMNAVARVLSGTKKYDRGLTHLLHSELHWLDVADRVTYKLGVTVYKCLHDQAPDYLSELCTPVAQVAERQHLRSASRHLLVVPRFQLDRYGRRTFAVAGPTTWKLFQNNLREPDMRIDCFRRTLNTCLFDQYSAH